LLLVLIFLNCFYFFFLQDENRITEYSLSSAESEIRRIEKRYCCDSPSWVSFLSNFKSASKYKERVWEFLLFADERNNERTSLVACLIEYFEIKRGERNADGSPRYSGTTFRGWFSRFLKFWVYTSLGDLRKMAPILEDNIGKWEKSQVVVKASSFEHDDLGWLFRIAFFLYASFDIIF
jgi:hypothetical protein